jgi:hypothetical protein
MEQPKFLVDTLPSECGACGDLRRLLKTEH